MQALVIGGTGPTGHFIVNGLIARGFDVTILHTGRHEVDEIPPSVEHIHTNPFKPENISTASFQADVVKFPGDHITTADRNRYPGFLSNTVGQYL